MTPVRNGFVYTIVITTISRTGYDMTRKIKIPDTDEAWDSLQLGNDEAHVKKYEGDDVEALIDDALDLQPISIRLQKSLIEDFKLIGSLHGVGYQPLMRQALKRFADAEKKRLLVAAAKTATEDKESPPPPPPEKLAA